jgi:thioredoxin 1
MGPTKVKTYKFFACSCLISLALSLQAQSATTVVEGFPCLATYALPDARLTRLKSGILLVSGQIIIREREIRSVIRRSNQTVRAQWQKNAFFLLERIAAQRILLPEALAQGEKRQGTSEEIVSRYLDKKFKDQIVSEEELRQYYRENKHLLGDPDLDPLKETLRDFLKKQKQHKAIRRYIRTLGQRKPIQVNADWVKGQDLIAKENPVDRLRMTGQPALVLFGAMGECPCDMVSPILIELGQKHKNHIEVLIISLREEKVLAERFGVRTIPDLILFDQRGREIYRHTGFLPERAIEEKLIELGLI